MPTDSYVFRVTLEGSEAIAAARQIRASLEKEFAGGFEFRQAKQQMADVSGLAQSAGANIGVMAGQMRGVTQEGGRLEVDLRNADDATRAMVSSLFQSEAGAKQLEQALRGGTQGVQATRQEIKWLGRDLEEVAKMGRSECLAASMSAAATQTYGLRTLAGGVGRMGTGMMAAGTAIVGPLTLAGKSYLEFADDANRAARQLKLNTDLTAELKSKTLDLSANLGLFTAEEISKGLFTWGGAIGAVAESSADLNALLEQSVEIQKLAGMNQEQLGTTTEFVAAIIGEFGMKADQVGQVVETLNYTADRTQATVGDLGEAFKYIGPIAASLGEDMNGVAAAMGVAADAGIKGSMSGRALRQLFIRLVDPTAEMNQAFNEALGLNEALGQSWQDIAFPQGEFMGLANFIDLLAASTEDMTDQQRQALLAQLATANELPMLTALVTKQIDARQQGINVLRAEEKIMAGVIDAEVRKYAEWKSATEGITVSLESATESWEREWEMYEESDTARADRIQKRWDAAWKRVGEAAVTAAVPALERLAALVDEISRYAAEHPEMVSAALQTGALLVGVGALVRAAGSGIKLYADVQMISAAAAMYKASTNMLEAAGVQAASNKNLLSGLGGIALSLGLAAAALGAEKYVVEKVGIPDWQQTQIARGTEDYEQYVEAMKSLYGKGQMETLTRQQWEAVRAGEELADVLARTGDEGTIATHDIAEEMKSLKEHERAARREAQGLGDDLMQLPPPGTGVAAFTEQELEAIDELESYLKRRNDMIEEQNDELLRMEEEFKQSEEEHYQDYLKDRDKLLKELEQVTSRPAWEQTEEYRKSQEKLIEAQAEAAKRRAEIEEDYRRKMRDLAEDHGDKMEDLEAARDAKGILSERTRYARSIRDAQEQRQDQLNEIESRLQETREKEEKQLAESREERRKEAEDKLAELDAEYQAEAIKRQADYDRQREERLLRNQQELEDLQQNHAEKLASIMGWEEDVRDALRQSYVGREMDLRNHLAEMERLYKGAYSVAVGYSNQVSGLYASINQRRGEYTGMQSGGYALPGTYRLGEAGREFVVNAPTTHALEQAIGPLTQGRLAQMAGGGGYNRLDIRVSADQHFSPEFAAQTEALVQQQIAQLASKLAAQNPSAYRAA